jgi:hypothetical protein
LVSKRLGKADNSSDNQHSLYVNMHGAVSRLECSYEPFIKFAGSYLQGLLAAPSDKVDVIVRLQWGASPQWNSKIGIYRRGRRILQDASGAETSRLLLTEILELPGLQLEIGRQENMLIINAFYRHSSRLARAAGRFNPLLPKIFVILIYYLVYFPLIYSLYMSRGWHLMHAGAVGRNGKGWVFAGLPGSGKSTFTLSLLSHPDLRLLSDNLLFYDSNRVYACPEPLHLSRESMNVVGKDVAKRLEETGRGFSHQRSDYLVAEEGRDLEIQPEALFFLGIASSKEYRRMPAWMAVERLEAYDRLAKEVNAYEQFAASLDLLLTEQEPERGGRITDKRQALAALVSEMACWELWVMKGEDLSQARQWLEDIGGFEEEQDELKQVGAVQSRQPR